MGSLFKDSEELGVAGELGKKIGVQNASNEFTIFFPSRIPQGWMQQSKTLKEAGTGAEREGEREVVCFYFLCFHTSQTSVNLLTAAVIAESAMQPEFVEPSLGGRTFLSYRQSCKSRTM